MVKRLITTLLGASLAVLLGAGAASASADLSTSDELAKAARYSAPAAANPAADPLEEGGEGGEGEECIPDTDPSVEPLFQELNEGVATILDEDEELAALDEELTAAEEAYQAALAAAESPDEVKAAFNAFVAAAAALGVEFKARFTELKPQFGELVEEFLDALAEANVCEDDIAFHEEELAGGQWFVDSLHKATDETLAQLIARAKKDRDDALKEFPTPNPRPDDTLPSPDEPGLPDTGASALPLLFGGLALISGGSTALLVARRRRTTA